MLFLWWRKEYGTGTSKHVSLKLTFIWLSSILDSNPSRLLSCKSLTGYLQLMLRTTLPHPVDFMFPQLSHFTLTKASTHVSLPASRYKSKLSCYVRFPLPSNTTWGHVFWIVNAERDLTRIPRTSPIGSRWQRAEWRIWSTANECQWFLCAKNPSAFGSGE